MKYTAFFLFVFIVFQTSCSDNSEKIRINDMITIKLPDEFKIAKNATNASILEATYKGENVKILKATYDLPDSLSLDLKKQAFVNNVNGFLRPFVYKRLDSTFSYRENYMQCDLNLDVLIQGKPKLMVVRLLAENKEFVVISYQAGDPNDKKSIKMRNKIFSSINME